VNLVLDNRNTTKVSLLAFSGCVRRSHRKESGIAFLLPKKRPKTGGIGNYSYFVFVAAQRAIVTMSYVKIQFMVYLELSGHVGSVFIKVTCHERSGIQLPIPFEIRPN
jgi:hypothetical protein